MIEDIEELKLLITHNLDVLDFLDILEISFPELVDILQEQCEEHYSKLLRSCR